jgi:hypothetical protein
MMMGAIRARARFADLASQALANGRFRLSSPEGDRPIWVVDGQSTVADD